MTTCPQCRTEVSAVIMPSGAAVAYPADTVRKYAVLYEPLRLAQHPAVAACVSCKTEIAFQPQDAA